MWILSVAVSFALQRAHLNLTLFVFNADVYCLSRTLAAAVATQAVTSAPVLATNYPLPGLMSTVGTADTSTTDATVLPASSENEVEEGATRIIVLLNMVPLEELVEDDAYTELVEELHDECARYGTITSKDASKGSISGVRVPRPTDVDSHRDGQVHASAVGKAFIEYAEVKGASNAAKHLRGRSFGGTLIGVEYYDEALYAAGTLK